MNLHSVDKAVMEAERFLVAARLWEEALLNRRESCYAVPKEAGACRRASMDLSRALSELRKPG